MEYQREENALQSDWSGRLEEDILEIARAMSSAVISSEQLVPGERREVAILFLDLSGFTALSEDLDHETVHRLASGIMRALSRTVEAGGGYLDKYEGDKIMALFGANRSYPDDCTRAVLAGIRMIEIVDQIKEIISAEGFSIGARAGVSYGSVTVAPDPSGHLTATGDEVNVASRMESSAEVGTVQVSMSAVEKCRDRFTWLELGEKQLKGRRKPVKCFRPLGSIIDRDVEDTEKHRLIGRSDYLDLLDKTFQNAALKPGEGTRAVILRGPDGIGKTALVRSFAEKIKSLHGYSVLFADGSRFQHRPFEMWVNALQKLFSEGSILPYELFEDAEKVQCLSHLMGTDEWEKAKQLSAESLRKKFSSVLVEALQVLSEREYVFITDDLQWIDSASAEVLDELISQSPDHKPLMVAGCVCTGEDSLGSVLNWIENNPRVTVRNLVPLKEDEIHSLVEEMISGLCSAECGTADPSLSKEVFSRSGGNPFIAVELVRHLLGSGMLNMKTTGAGWSKTIPESVKGLVRTRIDLIVGAERKALQIASLLGERFDEELFLKVGSRFLPWDRTEGLVMLSNLQERGILEKVLLEGRGYCKFASSFYRDVARMTVLRQNRVSLSRTAAIELSELEGSEEYRFAEEIANYWFAAGEVEKALVSGQHALDHYTETYQNQECLNFSQLMKNWLESDPVRYEANRMLILLREQKILYRTGRYAEMAEVLSEQLELALKRNDPTELGKTYCSIGELNRLQGSFSESVDNLMKAAEYSRTGGDFPTMGMCLNNLGALYQGNGDYGKAVEFFREAFTVQKKSGNLRSAGTAMSNIASMHHLHEEEELARKCFQEAAELFRRSDYKIGEAHVLFSLGVIAKGADSLEEALSLQKRSVELNRQTGFSPGLARALAEKGRLQILLSRIGQGESNLKEALELSRKMNDVLLEVIILSDLSLCANSRNSVDEACTLFNTAAELCGRPAAVSAIEMLREARSQLLDSGIQTEMLSELPSDPE